MRSIGTRVTAAVKPAAKPHRTVEQRITDLNLQVKKLPVDQRFPQQCKEIAFDEGKALQNELAWEFSVRPPWREPDDSMQAKIEAQGWDLTNGMLHTCEFLENYQVIHPEIPLLTAINPVHKHFLTSTFNSSFSQLSREEQADLISVIEWNVLERLDIPFDAEQKQWARKAAASGLPQLNEEHLLALVDYTSSITRTFNATNSARRIWHNTGADTLAKATSCVYTPLDEALHILEQYPAFQHQGPVYKGVQLNDIAGNFRLSQMAPGKSHALSHWWSATSDEQRNYASKHYLNSNAPRDTQITLIETSAVKVHLFNDPTAKMQKEVMVPSGTKLEFISEFEVDPYKFKRSSDAQETIYCKVKS